MVEDACQFVSSGGDGFWGAEFGTHAPVVVAKRRLVVMQCVSGDAQCECSAVLYVAGAHGKYLAAADTIIGTQAQLGSERCGAAKLGQIRANFR